MTPAHEVAGDGPTVVLVHAGIADSRMWEPQWTAWRDRFRVVRYDMRGFGECPLPPGRYSHARDLVAILDEVGPAGVIGASLGGRVALETAIARPDLVDRLVLVGPGLPGHESSDEVARYSEEEDAAAERGDVEAYAEANLRFWLDAGRPRDAVDPQVRELVHAMVVRSFELQVPEPEGAEEEPLVADVGERLHDVGVPVLLVLGEDDVRDIHAIAARLERGLPHVERTAVPGAAHLPSLERPWDFDAAVVPFLER